MKESIRMVRGDDKSGSDRRPQVAVDVLLRILVNRRQQVDLRAIAYTGQLLQCSLSSDGKAVQLRHHEVHYIIGVTLGVNAIEVPRPSLICMIEGEQSLFVQR